MDRVRALVVVVELVAVAAGHQLPALILDRGERDGAPRLDDRREQTRRAGVEKLHIVLAPPLAEAVE
jgi:hypothetical protein